MDIDNIQATIEEIDREFIDQGVPPFRRPIAAVIEFGRRNNISLPIVVNRNVGSNVPYPKENELITDIIHSWYKNRYGEALNVDFSPGASIVEVLGNLYELKVPKIWGSANAFWDSNFNGSNQNQISRMPVALNVAEQIPKLTPEMAKHVGRDEQIRILRWFILCFETFNFLRDRASDWPYRDQILTNLDSSLRYLICQSPNYGESLWASLQAAEKAIKSVLILSGQDPKRSHALEELAKDVGQHPKLRLDLLKHIQCKAGVRYGEEPVDMIRAKRAHYSVIEFIHDLMEMPNNVNHSDR